MPCTTILVGKKASHDGSTLIARNDDGGFEAKRIIIVTQEYHLYRALYLAEKLGLEAWGVAADYHRYAGQPVRDAREVLARVKDAVTAVVKPKPTYPGEAIPVSGDGNRTNDKEETPCFN